MPIITKKFIQSTHGALCIVRVILYYGCMDNPILLAIASDLMKAVHAKDVKSVADALESAYEELCFGKGVDLGPPDEDDG